MRKRSEIQLTFDYAAHGWAFCSMVMLEGKLRHLTELAKELEPNDKRHALIETIKEVLGETEKPHA